MEGEEDERYYIASEIRSILSTGNVTSAGHRYELLEGDMTWEESRLACELRGGYLTAITSWEGIPFYRTESQACRCIQYAM